MTEPGVIVTYPCYRRSAIRPLAAITEADPCLERVENYDRSHTDSLGCAQGHNLGRALTYTLV
jgi:hypothetical protein